MLSKIFKNKNKKKTLSEPIISVSKKLSENTKPIIYYSVDKQEYVTVYVPDHMSLYTKTTIQDTTTIQDNKLHKKIKTLSYNDKPYNDKPYNDESSSMIKYTKNDKLNDIYEYYINKEDISINYNDIDKNYNNYDENNIRSIYSNI